MVSAEETEEGTEIGAEAGPPRGGPGEPPPRADLLDTPLGHELGQLARCLLGAHGATGEAVLDTIAATPRDRLEAIAATVAACRRREPVVPDRPAAGGTLGSRTAAEVAVANHQLPQRQREALALRELMRLRHRQIGVVIALEPSAVAALLARARIALHAHLRGFSVVSGAGCAGADRALGLLARRQDAEALVQTEVEWLMAHLADCRVCERAHGAMLEASIRYRIALRP